MTTKGTQQIVSTVPLALRLATALQRELDRLLDRTEDGKGREDFGLALEVAQYAKECIHQGLDRAGITE